MSHKHSQLTSGTYSARLSEPRRLLGDLTVATALFISLLATGCSQAPLARHVTALSVAIAPVVDQSAAAYRDALALHDLRTDYEAVVAYEKKDATYNPRNTPVLLSRKIFKPGLRFWRLSRFTPGP